MSGFLTKDFLLKTETAKRLYHGHAASMPIIDYHCHVSAQEIYENRHFENLTEVWLGGDHYKWRLMRSDGVDERYITGDADPQEKFRAFAAVLPRAIGNPMYHWCHLELKNYFGYEGVLGPDTADEVYALANRKLQQPDMGVRGLIQRSNVAFIGTTDDPIDSLEWHKKLREDATMATVVAPSFRPDRALNIDKPDYLTYLAALETASGRSIRTLDDLKAALTDRLEYFRLLGCRASDHGLNTMIFREGDAERIFSSRLNGTLPTAEETEIVQTALLLHCAGEYHRLGMVMQLHYNCLRNPNSKEFARLGADKGFDCISPNNGSEKLAKLLDALYAKDILPKTILYSLDANDNAFLDTLMGAFQGGGIRGRIQHGSAWWFNDNRQGMRDQLISLGNLGLLGNFIGMLTDSRSFLSYTRHEYFRRILCDLLGGWVEDGEFPNDPKLLGVLVEDICHNNAKRYFDL